MKSFSEDLIDANEEDYLYIQISQIPNAGKGLFSAIPIFKGEIIAHFNGEILNNKKSKINAEANKDQYFMNLPNGKILDTLNTEGFAKYANDVSVNNIKHLKTNAIITLLDNGKVCLIAKRKIKCNEEIFCSYGKKYWEKHIL